jgi:hypothetical protein
MKLIRITSLILAVIMLSTMFVGCKKDKESASDLPKDAYSEAWYTVKVSFKIQYDAVRYEEGTDKKIQYTVDLFDVTDYEYESHKKPTILNIVCDYLAIETDYQFKVAKNNQLTKIGKFPDNKTQKGMYWAFAKGINNDKPKFIDKKMSEYDVVENNCYEFTLKLAKY